MKNTAIAVAALAVLAGGGWTMKKRLAKPSTTDSYTVTVSRGDIEESVDATGSVVPLARVEIKSPVPGRVEKLLVDEGQRVAPGQIIAWMSSSDRAAILDAARAQGPEALKRWEDAYKPTPIVASLPGTIILRNVVQGQTIDTSMTMFAMSDTLIAVAQVDESDIGRIRMGMPARITLDAYPDKHVTGKVFDILYEGKNVSNVIQYGVKIKVEKVPDYFRSQMTANVNFIVRRKEGALLLPASALRDGAEGKTVLVPGGEEGKAVPRPIKTGIATDQSVEVVEGLSEGDTVVVRQARYKPQQGPQSSPLMMGGPRPGQTTGQAPRPKK
ncbi:MAG: efflux RND transporter periplasmic adaptor subunit [Elusimicrobia bacterium]|nr:efflux RND transporter periplasmic adaptor subunit [Elusimicrobiota bacterium]